MQKNIYVPNWAWEYYQACQEKASTASDEAEEEKLNYLVRLFRRGKVPGTLQELEKLVDNHLAGNRQKVRRRIGLLEKLVSANNGRETDELLAARDSLKTIARAVPPEQWRLLNAIANGYPYGEVSVSFGVPAGTLKSTVSRVRSSLQELSAR